MSEIEKFFSNLMQTPDTPYSERAAARTEGFTSKFGPELEQFFSSMMSGGGAADSRSLMRGMQARGDRNRDMTQQSIMASGIPMQSTAMARALGGAMSDADLQSNVAMGGIEMDLFNQSQNRRFQGAAGLGGMPGLYSAPSSIEQAMFAMKAPYDLQRQGMQGDYYNQLMSQNYYQPEREWMPSGFDRYISPWLGPLMGGIGKAWNPLSGLGGP